MDLALLLLTSAAEITVSVAAVVLLSWAAITIANKLHGPLIAPVVLACVLTVLMLLGLGGGTIRAMILAFGISSALLMVVWTKLGPGNGEDRRMRASVSNRWSYPALVAGIGERRHPSVGELRLLLTRVQRETAASGLSVRSRAKFVKSIARAALRSK